MDRKTLALATVVVSMAACSSQTPSETSLEVSRPASASTASAFISKPATHASASGASQLEVAQAGLVTLTELVQKRQKYVQMGFRSPEEVASASLGEPMPIDHVGLDALRAYHRGGDLNALIVDTETAFYPTMVDGKAVSGIVVGRNNGAWAVKSFGRPTWAKAAQVTRDRITAARGTAPSALAFVEVDTPRTVLLVRHVEGAATMLTSVVDLPGEKLKAGEPLRAEDAIERLQEMAQ